jgi:hypothetical protein
MTYNEAETRYYLIDPACLILSGYVRHITGFEGG